jgi:hypothetical protein
MVDSGKNVTLGINMLNLAKVDNFGLAENFQGEVGLCPRIVGRMSMTN